MNELMMANQCTFSFGVFAFKYASQRYNLDGISNAKLQIREE